MTPGRPFRNTPDASVSLLRNNSDLLNDSYACLKSALEGPQIRALAVSGARRSTALPDIPTVQESGVSGFDVKWNALSRPRERAAGRRCTD
ncbi:MAG TPA: tripartite tricarboxylate transporter substrate-binding protein [Microvirga sp.]|nr:tripartite tricarboxylate transporter substrate-binding protein [Microvirga sp.]